MPRACLIRSFGSRTVRIWPSRFDALHLCATGEPTIIKRIVVNGHFRQAGLTSTRISLFSVVYKTGCYSERYNIRLPIFNMSGGLTDRRRLVQKSIALRIRSARQAARLTQAQLSTMLNSPQRHCAVGKSFRLDAVHHAPRGSCRRAGLLVRVARYRQRCQTYESSERCRIGRQRRVRRDASLLRLQRRRGTIGSKPFGNWMLSTVPLWSASQKTCPLARCVRGE